MTLAQGGATHVSEGLIRRRLTEVHGEIAQDALKGLGVQQAMGAYAGDDALHERCRNALDRETGHVGAVNHALCGELVSCE